MTKLIKSFIRLAVEKHPDKGGNEEEFKELYNAYETLGKLIEKSTDGGEEDKEEAEARKRFREETWEEVNSASITIKVNSNEGNIWEETLKEYFGKPTKNSDVESQNKGEKYSTIFIHEEEECKMFMTIYKPTKKMPDKQTIMVQSEKNQAFIVSFVDKIFPKLYKDVKMKVENRSKPHLRSSRKVSYKESEIDDEMDEDDSHRQTKARSTSVKE